MASSKYVLENGNKENDNLTRKGLSVVHKKVKRAKKVKEVLQNEKRNYHSVCCCYRYPFYYSCLYRLPLLQKEKLITNFLYKELINSSFLFLRKNYDYKSWKI